MDNDELHRRVMLLKEKLEKGDVKFRRGLRAANSLLNVRYGDDGKVDPATVDSGVRSLCLMIALEEHIEQLKSTPLLDVQRSYFDILDRFFGHPYAEMIKHNSNPHDIACDMASQKNIIDAFKKDATEFAIGIKEFWEYYAPIVSIHLQELHALKATFGGDIFPSASSNIACSTGLYIDTVILPDPLLRASTFYEMMPIDGAYFYLTKHALNALQYKNLALADVSPPIVVIAPDYSIIDQYAMEYLKTVGMSDLLMHCSKIFGRQFEEEKQLDDFLEQIKSVADLSKITKDSKRLLFDVEWKNDSIGTQYKKYLDEVQSQVSPQNRWHGVGNTVKMNMYGRMMQVNDSLFKNQRYSGVPLIQAPTSWQYLLWKYEYDQLRSLKVNPELKSLFITHALAIDKSSKLNLISKVPPHALIELRKRGAMIELRELFTKGLEEINVADEQTFQEVIDQVSINIEEAIKDLEKTLEDLSVRKRKYFGYDIGPWITTGAISITAATTGNIPLAILAAAFGMFGIPSAKDLWKKWKDILKENDEVKRSPIGILFNTK